MPSPTDARPSWARLERWLSGHLPTLASDLASGATEATLDALAQRTGLALPDSLRAVYRHHDGQQSPTPGLFFGLQFLSVRDAADEWARWVDVLQSDPALADDVEVRAYPDEAVRAVYASASWLPIATDGAGNGLAVDFDPGPAGTPGQIISFGTDEPTRYRLAASLADWIGWCAETCEQGRAAVVPDSGAPDGQALLLSGGVHLLDAVATLFGPNHDGRPPSPPPGSAQ